MSEIANSCNDIIKERKHRRLPTIARKTEAISLLRHELEKLHDYQEKLKRNTPAIIAIKEKAPQVVEVISNLDLSGLLGAEGKIAKLEKELERLKKRFGREAIQIALVGPARRGKSTFLQSVSGLTDDVIPTSSYSDCTGAVSVIENVYNDSFKIIIEYYDELGFIKFFNTTLENISSRHRVSSIADIRTLGDTLAQELKSASDDKLKKFYDEYYKNGLDYLDLIGEKPLTQYKESIVIEFVAKYKRYGNDEVIPAEYSNYRKEVGERKTTVYFNKYLAVKSAHIWSKYRISEAGKIIMLDTIGLGNENTEEKDRATMYKVLEEDTDAAIFNFAIIKDGMSNPPKAEIEEINKMFVKLDALSPERWVSVNINCYDDSEFKDNENKLADYQDLCNQIFTTIVAKKFGLKENMKPLHIAKVHNNCKKEVIDEMMLPVLEGIAKNVSELDEVFMLKAEKMADEIYAEYNDICNILLKSFDKIITQSSSFYETFTSNFNGLSLRKELSEYVGKLYSRRDVVCHEIIDELKPQISNLTSLVPSEEDITDILNGMGGGHVNNVYFEVSDHVTARIISKLKDVSTQTIDAIQEKVKTDIAEILYRAGSLEELTVTTGKITGSSDAVKWLKSFANEKLGKYPRLEDAVTSLLNFRMNIEGFIFAECIKACEILKDSRIDFPDDNESASDKAYFIWDTILRKVAEMKSQLNEKLGFSRGFVDFGQMAKQNEMSKPSLLLWCAADSFRKQFLDINHGEDLKSFYFEYAPIIWRSEFKMQGDISDATEEVNNIIASLKSRNDRALF